MNEILVVDNITKTYGKRVWDGKTGKCEGCFVPGVAAR